MLFKNHRPTVIDHFKGNTIVKECIKRMFSRTTIPQNIFITGDSGSGKTTLARIIASIILKTTVDQLESLLEYVEFNVPEWGAKFLVKEIKRHQSFPDLGSGYRVRVYDEFGAISKDSQAVFLKIIENGNKNFIHIFISSRLEDVKDPLLNRCVHYHLLPLDEEEMVLLLSEIATAEGFTVETRILREIARQCNCVPRPSITMLEQIIDAPVVIQAKYLVEQKAAKEAVGLVATSSRRKKSI